MSTSSKRRRDSSTPISASTSTSNPTSTSRPPPHPHPSKSRRLTTLYDVVAGRANATTLFPPFLPHSDSDPSQGSGSASTRDRKGRYYRPAGPREVLAKRRETVEAQRVRRGEGRDGSRSRSRSGSRSRSRSRPHAPPPPPEDYEYGDSGARARLSKLERAKNHDSLPSSDLLKALHRYTSLFQHALLQTAGGVGGGGGGVGGVGGRGGGGQQQQDGEENSYGTLDETALLALGILIQEASREVVGEEGWRVFVEPGVWGVEGDGGSEGGVVGFDDDGTSRSDERGGVGGSDESGRDHQTIGTNGPGVYEEAHDATRRDRVRSAHGSGPAQERSESSEDLDRTIQVDGTWTARRLERRI
ncbi:MAG: hypothetical protein M1828_000139 [Chrysothrix sp. TS-e1954]|nr:MAG: hypothetical protein M1828_000139 [Chrysothrix sp. TS-e1954]